MLNILFCFSKNPGESKFCMCHHRDTEPHSWTRQAPHSRVFADQSAFALMKPANVSYWGTLVWEAHFLYG